jgi:NAD(P)-dependent dehydrogenase (short-subunit alcohol dehydrogenase family)
VDVAGKVVVVTGAGAGIGAALVRESIARRASAVAVVDIDAERAEALARELASVGARVAAFTCDVSSYVEVEALAHDVVDRLGTPALVCSNAGINGVGGPVIRLQPTDVEWIVSVNLVGVWNCCSVFGQMLRSAGDGWLLNTGSEHSLGVPHLWTAMYTATKHAVLGMSDVMRRELAPHVGVSVLCPGIVSTQLWNAGRLRPQHLGGPIDMTEASAGLMERGMEPALVARLAFDGVAREAFVIPTHPHSRAYAEERSNEVRDAFDHLDALGLDIPSMDVTAMMREEG